VRSIRLSKLVLCGETPRWEKEQKVTLTETERLTNVLLAKQKELSISLRSRDQIVVEKASDVLDEVQLKEERDFAVRNLDRDSQALRQIVGALSRIADGTYGVCLHCDEEISMKRMAAVPSATFCIRCQEQIDNREIEIYDTAEFLSTAA
jgi:DnaK suppressor protein